MLRRPPLGHVLATAHDMSREHRIISALGPTDVPVPPAIGLCIDEAVNGSPFYVMGYVDGHVVRDASEAKRFTAEQRRRTGHSIVDTLARIHAVDIDAVGLGDLGRREGYIARQLKRWYGQWEQSKTRELPDVDLAYERLKASIPEQAKATIVHGDYRLDNCMVDDDGDVIAVLDWEICTLGDPLADVGLLMVYWSGRDDEHTRTAGRSDRRSRATRTGANCWPAMPRSAGAMCRRSTSTSRSATGSWRASSRASTPDTWEGRWARPPPTTSSSPNRSACSPPRRVPRPTGSRGSRRWSPPTSSTRSLISSRRSSS